MFESFSQETRRVIFHARLEATRLHDEEIAPRHLVLGYLREDHWLDTATISNLRESLCFPGPLEISVPTHGDMPLSEAARRALSSAFARAGGNLVTPLHILWAIAIDKDDPASKAVIKAGVTRDIIDQLLAEPPNTKS